MPLSIFSPAEAIRYTTHTRMPEKARATQGMVRNRSKYREMQYITRKDGMHTAAVATSAPQTPALL